MATENKIDPRWETFHVCIMAHAISVRISYRNRRHRTKRNGRNSNNLISVRHNNLIETTGRSKPHALPSFGLINARSLLPKIDELVVLLDGNPMDLVAITESWLHKDIDDSLISISDYNIYRNDGTGSRGGGVCVYSLKNIPCQRRLDFENPNFECLWLWICPTRLPRPLSAIAVCVVYNPPGRTAEELCDLDEYLMNTTDSIRNCYPNCRIVFLGDFNNFDVSNLTRSL